MKHWYISLLFIMFFGGSNLNGDTINDSFMIDEYVKVNITIEKTARHLSFSVELENISQLDVVYTDYYLSKGLFSFFTDENNKKGENHGIYHTWDFNITSKSIIVLHSFEKKRYSKNYSIKKNDDEYKLSYASDHRIIFKKPQKIFLNIYYNTDKEERVKVALLSGLEQQVKNFKKSYLIFSNDE